ncbi:MAG: zf-HC2 domain-containing protein [Candidatus Aminicenantes bacterium]|nr:zf-HC2 domain-containing protein [Candidatus Aminicenantes bacterium]
MKSCNFKYQIDDFLLDRLGGPDRDRFEEHIFNCDRCFHDVFERGAILAAVRAHGGRIFSPEAIPAARKTPSRTAFLRLWPYAAVAAAVLIAVWIGINPGRPDAGPLPLTAPVDDTVRGGSVELIGPLGALAQAPSALEWKTAGTGTDYSITLSGPGVAWSGRTAAGRIDLPADIRNKIVPGNEYHWKVRAFAPQGGFIGASQEGVFRIAR